MGKISIPTSSKGLTFTEAIRNPGLVNVNIDSERIDNEALAMRHANDTPDQYVDKSDIPYHLSGPFLELKGYFGLDATDPTCNEDISFILEWGKKNKVKDMLKKMRAIRNKIGFSNGLSTEMQVKQIVGYLTIYEVAKNK